MESTVSSQSFGSDFQSSASNYDHALYSPDLSNYSPHSTFMYEHDDSPDRDKKCVFEFPRPKEINDLGGELNTSFWSDGLLSETSFGESGKASPWDFSGFDDISSPLQHPEDEMTYAPTLAELNNEDSLSFDAMLSSHNAYITSTTLTHNLKKRLRNNNSTMDTPEKTEPKATNTPPRSQERVVQQLNEPSISLDSPSNSSKSFLPVPLRISGAAVAREKVLQLKTSHVSHQRRLAHQDQQRLDDAGVSDLKTSRCSKRKLNVDQKWQEIQSFIHEDELSRSALMKQDGTSKIICLPEGKKLILKEEHGPHRVCTNQASNGYDSHDEGLGSEHEDQDEEDDIDGEEEEEEEEEEDGSSDEELHNVEEEDEEEDACSDMSEDHDASDVAGAAQYQFPLKVKSRRSEYDDLTPNPKRLLHIGNELHKLNKIIGSMTPVSALPVNARNRSRKEKNKLASRACRLKKKAQHEANKVKLFGLEKEHDRLMQVITAIRKEILVYLEQQQQQQLKQTPHLTQNLNGLIKNILGQMVANHTQEFVNSVLEKTANGKLTGGLNFLIHHE